MENNGFQGGGMVPPGKYIHKSTGNTIYVRDCFQDGDSLVIMSDQGQLSMKEFSEYFQVEDGEDLYIPNLQDLYGGQPQNKNQLLAQINQGLDPEDRIKVHNNSGVKREISEDRTAIITTYESKPINKNYDLIKKVLDKFPVERTINFEIVEDEWPLQQFSMLVNVLDVPLEDICNYVVENYLNKEKLSNSLMEYFKEHIS